MFDVIGLGRDQSPPVDEPYMLVEGVASADGANMTLTAHSEVHRVPAASLGFRVAQLRAKAEAKGRTKLYVRWPNA